MKWGVCNRVGRPTSQDLADRSLPEDYRTVDREFSGPGPDLGFQVWDCPVAEEFPSLPLLWEAIFSAKRLLRDAFFRFVNAIVGIVQLAGAPSAALPV